MSPAKKETADDKKKPVAKKAAPKKVVAKKTAAKKPVAKKAAPKKVEVAIKKAAAHSKGKNRKVRVEDKFNGKRYALGVGKRKTAVALVRMHEKGKGEIIVNNIAFEKYFFGTLIENTLQPLALTGKMKEYDISVKVIGGGASSQADAIRHGIARALVLEDADLRPVLKKAGLLTRDSRVKERKKPGLRGARRSPQWSKR